VPRIEYLADHLHLAPLLATWHYHQWRTLLPEWSLDAALAELQSHTEKGGVPTTFVALDEGRPVGSVSLVADDLMGWEHLTPWLASLYVVPERRGQGLGKLLTKRVVDEARALSLPAVYLYTAGQEAFYEALGWSPHARTRHYGAAVVIMRRGTADELKE
jgi:predicted N-acetyltransferase YhbS